MTPLEKTLKREVSIDGQAFIVAISPEGIKLTLKGKRNGQELKWKDLVSGEAALAVALNASLGGFAKPKAPPPPPATPTPAPDPSPRRASLRRASLRRASQPKASRPPPPRPAATAAVRKPAASVRPPLEKSSRRAKRTR